MGQRVENGEGALYPHAEEVLAELKSQRHTLIFLSNCRVKYMERHSRVFGLHSFFDYFYCCEEFDFIPKYQIFRLFSLQHKGEFIVIGDRFHDIETAEKNGLKFCERRGAFIFYAAFLLDENGRKPKEKKKSHEERRLHQNHIYNLRSGRIYRRRTVYECPPDVFIEK
jgi:FMN phosphatase YigB (HAD superfamily)